MDTRTEYRELVQQVLDEYTRVPYAHGDITIETIFDTQADRYLLMTVGWDGPRRVHGCLVHIDIHQGKIWIQRDGTEEGIATVLVNAGVPKEQIVLGFQPAEIRRYTEFAAA